MALLDLFQKKYSEEEKKVFKLLRNIPVFSDMDNQELNAFVHLLHERKYKQDEVVFFREDPSEAFYIIEEGSVSLNLDHRKSFEKLQTLKEGESFGENVFHHQENRLYTAIVESEKANLLVLPGTAIDNICEKNSKIKAKIHYALSNNYSKYIAAIYKRYNDSAGFFELQGLFMDSNIEGKNED